jgi:hypothetical protein
MYFWLGVGVVVAGDDVMKSLVVPTLGGRTVLRPADERNDVNWRPSVLEMYFMLPIAGGTAWFLVKLTALAAMIRTSSVLFVVDGDFNNNVHVRFFQHSPRRVSPVFSAATTASFEARKWSAIVDGGGHVILATAGGW